MRNPRTAPHQGDRPAGAELAAPLEQVAVLEAEIALLKAWKDRASVIMFRLAERISALEGTDAQPELDGQSVAGFATKVHRSPSLVRKYIKAGRLPYQRMGARLIVAAGAALPARKRRP
jgi:hypothetical protein